MPIIKRDLKPLPNLVGKTVAEARVIVNDTGHALRIVSMNNRDILFPVNDSRPDRINVKAKGSKDVWEKTKEWQKAVIFEQFMG